jgi:hypothetical protein
LLRGRTPPPNMLGAEDRSLFGHIQPEGKKRRL